MSMLLPTVLWKRELGLSDEIQTLNRNGIFKKVYMYVVTKEEIL